MSQSCSAGEAQAVRPHTSHYRQAYSEYSMNEQTSLADITFTENGYVDVAQLNVLYRLIGWDRHNRRTAAETTAMLSVSHYYIAAHTAQGMRPHRGHRLIGQEGD